MSNLQGFLNGLDKKMQQSSGSFTNRTNAKVKEMLIVEASRLQYLLRQEISYYKTVVYPEPVYPLEYNDGVRTGDWENSIYVTEPFKSPDGRWVISIKFDRDKAIHPSVVHPDDSSQAGYVPWLLEVGWKWHNDPHPVHMFTYFEGAHYIQKAVQKFNASNPHNLKISVYWGDTKYI